MNESSLESRLERAYLALLGEVPNIAVHSDTRGMINRPTALADELEGYTVFGTDGATREDVPGLVALAEARRHPLYWRIMAVCVAMVLPHRYPDRTPEATKLLNTYYLQEPAPLADIHHAGAAARQFLLRSILDLREVIDEDGGTKRIDMSRLREPWQRGVFVDIILSYHCAYFVPMDVAYLARLYLFVTNVLRETPSRATPYFSQVVLRDFVLRYFDRVIDGVPTEAMNRDDLRDLARGLYASGALAPSFAKRAGYKTERAFCDTIAQCRMIDAANPGVIPEGAPKIARFVPAKLPGEVAGPGRPYRVPPGTEPYK